MTVLLHHTRQEQMTQLIAGCQKRFDEQTATLAANEARRKAALLKHRKQVQQKMALAEQGLSNLLALAAEPALVQMIRLSDSLVSLQVQRPNDHQGLVFYGVSLKQGGVYISFLDKVLRVAAGEGQEERSIDQDFPHGANLDDESFADFKENLFAALDQQSKRQVKVRWAQSALTEVAYDFRELLAELCIYCASLTRLGLLVEDFLSIQAKEMQSSQN